MTIGWGVDFVNASDVDNDGDIDVLGASWGIDEIVWWENTNGTGTTWEEHFIAEDFPGAMDFCIEDIDNDGDIDVTATGIYRTSWWENVDASGESWLEHPIGSSYSGVSINTGDISGDGNPDFVSASYSDSTVCWWDLASYSSVGTLESSILDAGNVEEWDSFVSDSQEPAGTSVSFQFRSSHDFSNMGAWSDTVFSPDTLLEGILADSTRYLQYRVILETSDSAITPELSEVSFDCSIQLGIRENPSSLWSLHFLENPSTGFFSALVSVAEDVSVELSLYDVSGRMVAEVSQELPAGTHSVNFTGLAQGVYFCTMRAGDYSATERVVVLK